MLHQCQAMSQGLLPNSQAGQYQSHAAELVNQVSFVGISSNFILKIFQNKITNKRDTPFQLLYWSSHLPADEVMAGWDAAVQLNTNVGSLEEGWWNGEKSVWQKMSGFSVLMARNNLICKSHLSCSPYFHFRYKENNNHSIILLNSHLLCNRCFPRLVFW